MITLAKLAGLTRELTTGSTGEPLRKGDKTIEKTYIYVRTGLYDASRNPLLVAIAALTPGETVIHTSTTYSPTKGSDAAEIVNQIAASVWKYGNSRNAKQFCYDLQICITSLNKAIEKHKGSFLTRMFSDKQKFAEDANNLIEALEWLRRNIDVDPVVGQQFCAELELAARPRVKHGDYTTAPYPNVGHGYSPHGMQPGQPPTAPATPYGEYPDGASDGSHGWTPGHGSEYAGSTPPGSEHDEWPHEDHSSRGPRWPGR